MSGLNSVQIPKTQTVNRDHSEVNIQQNQKQQRMTLFSINTSSIQSAYNNTSIKVGSSMKTDTEIDIDQFGVLPKDSDMPLFYSLDSQKLPKKIYAQSFSFIIFCQQFQYSKTQIIAKSTCLNINGRPLMIPSSYQSTFLESMNSITQNCQFCFSKQSSQIQIFTTLQNIGYKEDDYWVELKGVMEFILKKIQIFLQIIGYSKQFNSVQKKLKTQQLRLRKQTLQLLSSSIKPEFVKPETGGLFCQEIRKSQQIAVQQVYQITEIDEQNTQKGNKNGGFFNVFKRKCKIAQSQSTEPSVKYLAAKKPKTHSNISQQDIQQKMFKQIEFVKKVDNQSYLGKYYTCQNDSSKLYMDYVPHSLKDLIIFRSLSISELVDLGLQLVEGVKHLHSASIVHRDLKPQNILITNENHLQIIDFGESVLMDNQKQERLGCTMPYSPPECLLRNIEGFNKKEIDYWSVIMVLYEMTFNCLPLSFSRILGGDIIESWKNPQKFSIFPSYHKRTGIEGMKEIISLLAISGLKISQSERLNLHTVGLILQEIETFSSNCFSIFSHYF